MTKYVLIIDIGGTKIAYGILACDDQQPKKIIFSDQVLTQKGQRLLSNQVFLIYEELIAIAKQKNIDLYKTVGICAPGKYVDACILSGSANNLNSQPFEFDGVNLSQLLTPSSNRFSVQVFNDAEAQMIGGINQLMQDNRSTLCSTKVAYIGPGSGLGGGFATIDAHGVPDLYTDGHVSDILLKDAQGQMVTAESVFSGRSFFEQTGKTLQAVNASFDLFNRYLPLINQMAEYAVQLMRCIYLGQVKKQNQLEDWSNEILQQVKGTSVFLLGGSIGTKGRVAVYLLAEINRILKQNDWSYFQMLQIPDTETAALFGGAYLLLK